ncbi:hypothetical protein ACFL4E_01095 [Candidatus Omnitrophota bacterium]
MKKLLFVIFVIALLAIAIVAYTLTEVQVDRATREVNVTFWERAKELMRAVRKKPKIGIDGEPVRVENEEDDGRGEEENNNP